MHSASTKKSHDSPHTANLDMGNTCSQVTVARSESSDATATHARDIPFNTASAAARAGVLVGLLLARR